MSEALPATIGVMSQNLLLDKTRSGYNEDDPRYIEPQSKRVDSIAQTMGSVGVAPDIVALQEVHVTSKSHSGERIAEHLGVERQFWYNHNTQSRSQEYIGVCGHQVESAESFDVGDDRLAILAMVRGIGFIIIHNRFTFNPLVKASQMSRALKETEHIKKRVVLGDANDSPISMSWDVLRKAGFKSGYVMKNGYNPITYPTPNYRNIMFAGPRWPLRYRSYTIDVFHLAGFEPSEINHIGTEETKKSDHFLLHGELAPKAAA
jgi:endonuclease/exonuclease/phosphatase family metal-dependent hydrolase